MRHGIRHGAIPKSIDPLFCKFHGPQDQSSSGTFMNTRMELSSASCQRKTPGTGLSSKGGVSLTTHCEGMDDLSVGRKSLSCELARIVAKRHQTSLHRCTGGFGVGPKV